MVVRRERARLVEVRDVALDVGVRAQDARAELELPKDAHLAPLCIVVEAHEIDARHLALGAGVNLGDEILALAHLGDVATSWHDPDRACARRRELRLRTAAAKEPIDERLPRAPGRIESVCPARALQLVAPERAQDLGQVRALAS